MLSEDSKCLLEICTNVVATFFWVISVNEFEFVVKIMFNLYRGSKKLFFVKGCFKVCFLGGVGFVWDMVMRHFVGGKKNLYDSVVRGCCGEVLDICCCKGIDVICEPVVY